MVIFNVVKIYRPNAVAGVGAGETQGSIGHALLRSLAKQKVTGVIHPVNPRHEVIENLHCFPAPKALEGPSTWR
jgi:acyl-CoA synthetase (NDP forming)